MSQLEDFEAEVRDSRPTCRRGEGFLDNIEVPEAGHLRGRAVPYGRVVQLTPGLVERFERGAFANAAKDPARVKICYEHGQVIGRMRSLEDRDDGHWIDGRISLSDKIPEAATARALLEEDPPLVDELSVGFQTVKGGTKIDRLEDGTVMWTHTRARLLEVSLVPWGAYGRGATVSRSQLIDPAVELRQRRVREAREWLEAFKARR